MRSFEELAKTDDPAWPHLQKAIAEAKNPVEVLPPADGRAESLVAIQVTLHSTLGAVVYETGGLRIDHGWIRLLGSGHPRLPRTLPSWNFGRGVEKDGERPRFVLVGDDAVGGFFAIDGGQWGTKSHVHYFAPDTLRWEDTGRGYSDFVAWCLTGDLAEYYADYRWPGWENEVEALAGDRAFAIAPPPFTAGEPFSARSRRDVPIAELYGMYMSFAEQLDGRVPPQD